MKTQFFSRSTSFGLNPMYVLFMAIASFCMVLCISSCASEYCKVDVSTKGSQISLGLYYYTNQYENEGTYTMSYDNSGRIISSSLNSCDTYFFSYDNNTSSAIATSIDSQQSTKVLLNSKNLPVFMDDVIYRYSYDNEGRLKEIIVSDVTGGKTSFTFSYYEEELPAPYRHVSYSPHMFSTFVGPVAGLLLSNLEFKYIPQNCMITQKNKDSEEHYELFYKLGNGCIYATLYKYFVENGEILSMSIEGLSCYSEQ